MFLFSKFYFWTFVLNFRELSLSEIYFLFSLQPLCGGGCVCYSLYLSGAENFIIKKYILKEKGIFRNNSPKAQKWNFPKCKWVCSK